jgi:glutamate carboxypeptidase
MVRGDIDLDGVSLLITTDEEVGSPTSRRLVEDCARAAGTVLVLEPSAAGSLKTSRKGVSMYSLDVTGRAAHAGLDPEAGINALLELADQLRAVAALGDAAAGTTVSPTRARAGTTTNTIPAVATADVDVRAWTAAEQQRVDQALQRLAPVRTGARVVLHGGINRLPLEASMSAGLFARALQCADSLGLPPLTSAAVGGGSDGNFSAAVGVPTLDGLGAVGGGAHAEGEHVVVEAMAHRAALVHALVVDLQTRPLTDITDDTIEGPTS